MKVIQILPKKKSRLLVKFDNGDYLIASKRFLDKFSIQDNELVDSEMMKKLIDHTKRLIKNRITKIITRREISSKEIMQRLTREGYNQNHIRPVIQQLKESGLMDDHRYARSLIHDWTKINPRGNLAIIRELKKNGLNPDDYSDLLQSRNQIQLAVRLVRKRINRVSGTRMERRKKLVQSLLRRGFAPDIVEQAMAEVGHDL